METEKELKPYVKVPNKMTEKGAIAPKDLLIYANLIRFAKNSDSCYPSLDTLSKCSGAAVNTIKKCLNNLVNSGYISITPRKNQSNIYTILKRIEGFEKFSEEFLDDERITFTEKSYLMASQQYMFKKFNGEEGKIGFTNGELSEKINMPVSTIKHCNTSLKRKDLMSVLPDGSKIYNLAKFNLAVVQKLKEHDDEIKENKEDIKELRNRVKAMEKELQELKDKQKPVIIL